MIYITIKQYHKNSFNDNIRERYLILFINEIYVLTVLQKFILKQLSHK